MTSNSIIGSAIFGVALISCGQRIAVDPRSSNLASSRITGIPNTDSTAPPIVTLLTAANAPKVMLAGKPVIRPNPHLDGLGDPDFTHFGTKEGLALENTTDALMDRMGNLWFASWGGGVSKYDGT
jgi:hypothetical protein